MRIRTALALLVSLTTTAPAIAQDAERPLRLAEWVYTGAAAADWTSTAYCTAQIPCQERNPMFRWAEARYGSPAMIGLGVATDVVTIWAVHRWIGPAHPAATRTALYLASAFRVGLTIKNTRVGFENRNVQPCHAAIPLACAP